MRPTVCSVRQRQALRRRARSLNDRVHLVEHGVELVELRSQLLLGHGRRGGGVARRALWRADGGPFVWRGGETQRVSTQSLS